MADQNPVAAALLAKFLDLCGSYRMQRDVEARFLREANVAGQRCNDIWRQAQDFHGAAHSLGFDLIQLAQELYEREKVELQPETLIPPEPEQRAVAVGDISIRDFVLEQARQASPAAVRATALRQMLEARGTKTHEKTIGMTLYRLLKAGLLRRHGWDWFYVPTDDREPMSGHEKPGGGSPGLFEGKSKGG